MLIREITDVIERFAPLAWQESYDNAGLIVGRPDDEVRKALLAVDVTDEVMAEAEREGCDLIITHHPIVFHALKRFNSADQVQRCVERAIRSGIALYACHTNLDSAPEGMSWRLAEMLGVADLCVLQPSAADAKVGFGVANCREPWRPWSSCAISSERSACASCVIATSLRRRCAAWRSARGPGLR